MSDSMQDDIAYMKSLAQAGERGPLKNGASLFWAGLVYGAAAVAQYASIEGYLPRSNWIPIFIWGGASVIFALLAIAFNIGRWGQAHNVANRAALSAWSGVGLAIGFFILSMIVITQRVSDFSTLSFLIAPVVLIIYGIGWWVSAKMAERGWLKLVAFGCFLAAPALCAMVGRPEQLLAYAACLVLFATVPGFILMREKA
ncbi:MAG TPA: hypothetical protein VG839_07440 [Asticcacaulis sp.]|nr:hypothetical protein [Asticcacaulis sp.]